MSTYSFQDVVCSLSGPGLSINMGAGAAVAEEGITFEYEGDKNTVTMGADGEGMNSLRAAKNGTATVRLLKTSPVNQKLQAAYNAQLGSAVGWGQMSIDLNDTARGDVVHATQVAFKKGTGLTFATDAGMNEWSFTAIKIHQILGPGV